MMTFMHRRFTNRGIATIIAALLLIAIAIAAGVLLYVFSMGLMGSLSGSGGQQVKDQVIMEAYNWVTSNTLIINFRNTGSTTVNLFAADYYLGGAIQSAPAFSSCTSSNSATVVPGGACTATLTVTAASYLAGVAYVLKVALADGGVMSYACIDGTAS
jgi:FlaG/FlaF family flagellin (archaellin)